MSITIYHNPRCSKSRKTLEIIESSGIAPDIVDYLANPPDATRILELAAAIGVPVRELVRQHEDAFRAAPDLPALEDDAALAAWLAANPKVLQRPLIVDDASGRAVIGRPPENVRALLG